MSILNNVPPPDPEIWTGDFFHRSEDARFLKRFLLERVRERGDLGVRSGYVLNIDAGWGRGKSFFLNGFEKELRKDGFLVARVNA